MIIHGHHFYQFVWSMHMSKTEEFKSKLKFYTFPPKLSPLRPWDGGPWNLQILVSLLSRCSKPNLLKSDPVVLKRREEDLNRRTTTDINTPKAITEVTWVTYFLILKTILYIKIEPYFPNKVLKKSILNLNLIPTFHQPQCIKMTLRLLKEFFNNWAAIKIVSAILKARGAFKILAASLETTS